MIPKKLFVIDAMAMIYRNYYGYYQQNIRNSNSFLTSAIYGCAVSLMQLIEKENPNYLVIASDTKGKVFRHKLSPQYKANRKATPKDLLEQLPLIYEMFDLFQCKTITKTGYEADDIIGTIAKQCENNHFFCYIVSRDKDFLQLINDTTYLYYMQKGNTVQIIDKQGVFEKFSCLPSQVIDILSIWGDAADNIQGVPGIGEKGAQKLIRQFGSLENIYKNIDQLTNKRQQKALSEHQELAFLAKQLVTIKTDVELDFSIDDFIFDHKQALASQELYDFFKKLEMQSLMNRILINLNHLSKQTKSYVMDIRQ